MPDDSSSHPGFSYRHPVFLRARNEAFARSGGVCQLCGQMPAEHAHHWAETYPPADKTTAHDLTGLCAECHLVFVTTFRRFTRAGGSRHQFCALLSEVVERCDLNSPLPASPPSSCTTARARTRHQKRSQPRDRSDRGQAGRRPNRRRRQAPPGARVPALPLSRS